ncbi:MAG: hypothetical protein WAO20_12630 [Acidobacteriota bacterium]
MTGNIEDSRSWEYYLMDLGTLLKEAAFEARRVRDSSSGTDRDFLNGRLMGYYEVISLMLSQCGAFGLPANAINLGGIDPDRDLV